MGEKDRILEMYRQADADERLVLSMEHRDLRHEFMELDLAQEAMPNESATGLRCSGANFLSLLLAVLGLGRPA